MFLVGVMSLIINTLLRNLQDKKIIFYFLMPLIIVTITIMENMVYDSVVCDGNSLNP